MARKKTLKTDARRQKKTRTSKKSRQSRKSNKWLFVAIPLCLIIIATIVVVVIISTSNKNSAPESSRSYAKYRDFYEEVLGYNYGHGGNQELENRILKVVDSGVDDNGGYFFCLMAAAEYYYYTLQYETAEDYVKRAGYYAPTDAERIMIFEFYLKYYKALNDTENYDLYKGYYDDYLAMMSGSCGSGDEQE